MNATQIEQEKGVETVPCASGWCMKIIESRNLNNGNKNMESIIDKTIASL